MNTMIDPIVIDGVAVGFLIWASQLLWYIFVRRTTTNLPTELTLLGAFVGSGAAIGWLWP